MKANELLDKALDFIVETQEQNDYICEQMVGEHVGDYCEKNCQNLNKECVKLFLEKVYKKDEKQGEMPLPSDYDKAFDEFLSHIPEKDPESSNSLYTYEDLESAIQFGIRWQKEQKPAWSEEDERRINNIIAFMSDKERIKDTERMFPIEEDIRWLKSLRHQPKQGLSEDEEGIIVTALSNTYSDDIATKLLNKIKSLRPQKKEELSEENLKQFRGK